MNQCVVLSDSIHAQPHHPQLAQLQRVLFVTIGKGQLPMIIDRLGARHHDFDMFGILRRAKHPCEDSLLKSLLNTSDLYDFWCWSKLSVVTEVKALFVVRESTPAERDRD